MIFYVLAADAARSRCVAADGSDLPLWCTTVVLRHPSGFVGFNDREGTPAMRALVSDVVVVAQRCSPAWLAIPGAQLSIQPMHSAVGHAATLSNPSPALMRELETVSRNDGRAKQNVVLARHGKGILPLTPTIFDDWLTADGKVRHRNAARISSACDFFVLWSHSDWGYYAQFVSTSSDTVLARIRRAALDVHATMKEVATESELPSW